MRFPHFIPAILWFLLTVILLCLPGAAIPKYPWLAMIHADKWIHIGMFFILCILFSYPLQKSGLKKAKRKKWFLLITCLAVVYGTFMEFVQDRWIPNRSFELWDIAADSTGSLLALWYSIRIFLRESL